MDNLTSILEFIKIRGPIIPIQAAKEIGTNILMASAMLSELSAKGSVKVSSIKVGGTPLYYTPGQEIKLQSYLKYLNDKQKVAYEKLKQQKILLDTKLEPVMRQALRQIKDFAKPLEVTSNQETSLFWKWYLLPNDEATRIIKNKLGMKSTKKTPSTPKTTPSSPPKQKSQKTPLEKISQKKEIKKHSPPKTHPFQSPQDTFVEQMLKYFSKNNIRVVEHNLVRKNSESDFIVEIPSALGGIKYYCKAKNKKFLNEGDLSSTYGKSQLKKLPALLLTTGKLSKKAQLSADTEFHQVKIIQV